MKLCCLFPATLRRQLSLFLILLVMSAISAIGIASVKIAQQVIKNHTARFGGKMLTQAAYRLGSVIDNAETTVDSLILDRRLAPLLQDLKLPPKKVHDSAQAALHALLVQYKSSLLPGAELIIIDTAGNIISTYDPQPLPEKVIPDTSVKVKAWRLRHLPNYYNSNMMNSGRLLELTARIISLPGQPQSGWIVLHMDYRTVESIMTNISLLENSLSRFQSDAVVYGPDQQVIFPWINPSGGILDRAHKRLSAQLRDTQTLEDKFRGVSYLIIATPVPWTSWQLYIAAPTQRLYTGLEQIYESLFMIGFICTVIAIISATLFSFFVTQPVNKLRNAMSSVEEGQFSVRAPEGGPLEIQILGRAFNRMLHEVDRLTKRLVAEESARKTTMIKALQAQISPHFLFNTLAAMAGMTLKRPPEEVAEALRSLKRLLYLSIGKNGDFVSLADEFEHIHHYLYLMNIRYPERYFLDLNLPEELRKCRTIRLILQPIVENCLQHGLKSRRGRIDVSAVRDNQDIIISVSDNGQGMSREQLSGVWKRDRNRSGVGIRNVDERLKLSFGQGYGITLNSFPEQGTTVLLRIPFQYIETDPAKASQ